MMKIESANQIRSRGIGVLVLGLFGTLWILLALLECQRATPGNLIFLTACALAFSGVGIWLLRLAGRLPRGPEDPARSRAFLRINAITWTAAIAANLLLHGLKRDVDFLPVLAIIVGLHFIPLGRLFANIPQIGTGIFMTFWAVITLFFVPAEHLPSIVCFGCGLILWQSATITLAVAWQAARESGGLLLSPTQPISLSE